MYISHVNTVAKACLFTAEFSQLSIFTADCLSSYPDGGYRNRMGVAHSYCYQGRIEPPKAASCYKLLLLLSYVQDLKQKTLEIGVLCFLKKALTSREEPDISLSTVNSKARLHLLYSSLLTRALRSTHAMILYVVYIERVTSRKRKNSFGSRCEG